MEFRETSRRPGITSRYGLNFEQGDKLTLSFVEIPQEVMDKVGGRDVVTRKIHPEIFNGSHPLGGEQQDSQYVVEFPSDMPIEKIQEFVDAIEALADQAEE